METYRTGRAFAFSDWSSICQKIAKFNKSDAYIPMEFKNRLKGTMLARRRGVYGTLTDRLGTEVRVIGVGSVHE